MFAATAATPRDRSSLRRGRRAGRGPSCGPTTRPSWRSGPRWSWPATAREDPEAKLDAFRLTHYEERIRDFDGEAERVFYRVQDLEREEDTSRRAAVEPGRAVSRYELGSKLITLALILLSVTILSSKRYLLWAGVTLGSIGLLVALDGYFLFL